MSSLLVALLLLPGQADSKQSEGDIAQWIEKVSTGQPVPALKGRDIRNAPVSLTSFRNKPVLIDVWSMTCPPCLCFAPELRLAHEDGGFPLLGINVDRNAEKVTRTMKMVEMDWPVLFDRTGRLARTKFSLPLYIVLDSKHIVRYRGDDHRKAIHTISTVMKKTKKSPR